jgi:hypothetical protein
MVFVSKALSALAICAALSACAGESKLPISPTIRPHTPLILHADTAFTPDERWALDAAADEWTRCSHEVVVIVIEYDLNFDDVNSIRRLQDQNLILKVLTDKTDLIEFADHLIPGAKTIGFTQRYKDYSKPVKMELISPRLTNRYKFAEVAKHELGHALHLDHVDDSKAVMNIRYSGTKCLNKSDMTELCRVYGCNVEQTAYCD